MCNNPYRRHGCENRDEYLETLIDEYGCPPETVYELADLLGPNEDFDGLVSALNDWEDML